MTRDPYRRSMRRARRALRKDGNAYPLMIIGPDEPLGIIAAEAIGRWAFRHRSAFLPFLVTGAVFITAAIAHHHHARWWITSAFITTVVTIALGIPHRLLWQRPAGRFTSGLLARLWEACGIDRPAERAYAATVTACAGGWLTAGIALGPATQPLPKIAGIATVILGIPWWVHRRRRARVRIERTIQAWPSISDNIGLPGSRIASAAGDAWGWTARVILRKGGTAEDAIGKIPAIESGLGVRKGSVRVIPDPARADRFTLRVIEKDPHAEPIAWPGTTSTSITRPAEIGLSEDGQPVRVLMLRRHVLIGGTTGAGKSGIVNIILAFLAACGDVVIWAVDLKGGMELQPWASCIQRLAVTPDQATGLFRDAATELSRRAAKMAAEGKRSWDPSPDNPALVIVVDEYAEMPADAHPYADSVARLGRAVAVDLLAATQRPSQDAMGKGAVRSQMDVRICLRVRERRDADLILGQGSFNAGWHAHALTQPGAFLISDPEHAVPERNRAYLITDQQITSHAAQHARARPAGEPDTHPTAPRWPHTTEPGPDHGGGPRRTGNSAMGRPGRRGPRGNPGRRAARAHRDDPAHALPAPPGPRPGRARGPGLPRLLAGRHPARHTPAPRPEAAARP